MQAPQKNHSREIPTQARRASEGATQARRASEGEVTLWAGLPTSPPTHNHKPPPTRLRVGLVLDAHNHKTPSPRLRVGLELLGLRMRLACRRGVTLLEVMFSIGIMMVGLVGIASIIPLAGRQAATSYALTHAAAQAENVYREILARDLHQPNSMKMWVKGEDEPIPGAMAYASLNFTAFASLDELYAFEVSKQVSQGLDLDVAQRNAWRTGFCIDPLFWADQPRDTNRRLASLGTEAGYRRTRFPYYLDWLNPLTCPTSTVSLPWSPQPRLQRISYLLDGSESTGRLPRVGQPIRQVMAQRLVTSFDNLVTPTDDSDESLPGIRGMFTALVSGNETYAQAASDQQFTWIATLIPYEQDSIGRPRQFTLSVVVFNRRNRSFEAPKLAFSDPMPTLAPPTGERIAWAVPVEAASNAENFFTGGNGFTVELRGCAGSDSSPRAGGLRAGEIDSDVRAGDWVMLSREFQYPNGNVKNVFKWYRVVSADSEPTDSYPNPTTQPFGQPVQTPVWHRTVRLMGPDWIFSGLLPGNIRPTTATLVNDVIAVHERIVEIP